MEPGTQLGPYEIKEPLGKGGMGEVYRARDTKLERDVAVKVLPAELAADRERQDRLREEARTLAALDHPNIVTVYAVGESDGVFYLAMQLVEGETLATRLSRGSLPTRELLDLAIPLVDAVATSHEHGIVHGDLKPGNIVLGDDGRLRVLDFGLARRDPGSAPVADASDSSPTAAATDAIEGTLGYTAPERFLGHSLDARGDVFSLGVVLYEMAAGRPPFVDASPSEGVAAMLESEPLPLRRHRSDLPLALAALIGRCLAVRPEDRYPSAAEIRRELASLSAGESSTMPTARDQTLAVLPFTDLSADADQGYFCDGLAEELLTALARIRRLQVASRTSSFQFKESALDVREAGRRLGVATVLEGSVRKAGDRLRIAVRLVDVGTGYQLWSSRYDRQLEDVFAIQEEIAESIVDSLRVTLTQDERQQLLEIPTHDLEAYELYLQGKQIFHAKSTGNYLRARRLFEAAVARDPDFGLAHAAVAECSCFQFMYTDARDANLERALEASQRALELEPRSAAAHASRGLALSLSGAPDEAERAFRKAIDLDPRHFDAHYFYARYCHAQGRLERAAELYQRAASLDPDDHQSRLLVIPIYRKLGRREEAREAAERGLLAAERYLRAHPEDGRAAGLAAGAALELGDVERARSRTERALERYPDNIGTLYNAACVLSLLGDVERSLDCLERARELGFAHKAWLEHDADLDNVRHDPRFERLLRQLG